MARIFGLQWARSSVAAIEAGNRDLSLEEMLLLPFIVSKLGGWDEPLIARSEIVMLSQSRAIAAGNLEGIFRTLFHPSPPSEDSDDSLLLGAVADKPEPGKNTFECKQNVARRVGVYDYILLTIWPDFRITGDFYSTRAFTSEVNRTIWSRLSTPDGGEVPIGLVRVFAFGLWGRLPSDERDARTEARGRYENKRALQSARGHLTRGLISELQEAINTHWPVVKAAFDELNSVIDDERELDLWNKRLERLTSRARGTVLSQVRQAVIGRRGRK